MNDIAGAKAEAEWSDWQMSKVEDDLSLALDLLAKVQRAGTDTDMRDHGASCPSCKQASWNGHHGGCTLAQLLARHGREVRFAS